MAMMHGWLRGIASQRRGNTDIDSSLGWHYLALGGFRALLAPFLARRPPAGAMEMHGKCPVVGAPREFWACGQPMTTPLRHLYLIRHLQDLGMAAATCTRDENRKFPEQGQGCDLQVEVA